MTLTRIALEKILVARAKNRMAFVGMSTSSEGANGDLNDPLATALQQYGIEPADISNVSDGDLIIVESASKLADLAELRLLENIMGNADMVDIKVGERSESLSQFTAALEKAIRSKTEKIERQYGVGLGTLSGGVVDLDFQEKADDANVD